jgi:hypothetical protein
LNAKKWRTTQRFGNSAQLGTGGRQHSSPIIGTEKKFVIGFLKSQSQYPGGISPTLSENAEMLPSEIILKVCQDAIPSINPLEVLKDSTGFDSWNASRLKSIIASRMLEIGMTKTEISTYLGQTWNATASQIRNAPKLKKHPRYKHHFKP